MKKCAITTIACVLTVASVHAQPLVPAPVGITNQEPIYYPNASADTLTGLKPGWSVVGSVVDPEYGMWQNAEHGIVQVGTDHVLLLAMETNRNYRGFFEAINFVEMPSDVTTNPTTPNFEGGYWRGDTIDAHPHIWAPDCIEHEGTYYLFFPAPAPGADPATELSCYLATSTTGAAGPSAWVEFDPNPGTAVIEPLFTPPAGLATGYRDFNIAKVDTSEGLRFYNYYSADPFDSGLGEFVSEVRMRVSDSLTSWPDSGEVSGPVFRKVNVGETFPSRYFVDYENPNVEVTDDGFYLFVSRHGQVPADVETNVDWEPIPLSTEVYYSADGLLFDPMNRLPNLKSGDGFEVNSTEILNVNDRWFATNSLVSNQLSNFPFDCCPAEAPTDHSEITERLVNSYSAAEDTILMFEFEFQAPVAAGSWFVYE